MENTSSEMGGAFMEVVTKKLESQDGKLAELEEKIKTFPNTSELLQGIINRVDEVKTMVMFNQLPAGKLQEFSTRLSSTITLLQQPVENKVLHHHHVPKLLWVSVGLFLAVCLVSSGWLVTVNKLDGYIANDTKYRHLKLDTANKGLQKYLYTVDSFYRIHPNMRELVIEREEENRKNAAMLDRAKMMESEAGELKKKVFKQKPTKGSTKQNPVH